MIGYIDDTTNGILLYVTIWFGIELVICYCSVTPQASGQQKAQ
jgi:hypothetical protein